MIYTREVGRAEIANNEEVNAQGRAFEFPSSMSASCSLEKLVKQMVLKWEPRKT